MIPITTELDDIRLDHPPGPPRPGMSWHGPVMLHGTVTDIQCKGPMKDYPGLTLYTAMVKPLRSRRAMAVTLCTKTADGTPEPDEFLKSLITDLLIDAIPAA